MNSKKPLEKITSRTELQKSAQSLELLLEKYRPLFMEVRRRLFLIISFFVGFSLVGFLYYEKVIAFSLTLFRLEGVNVVFTSPFQFFDLSISSAFFVGSIASAPLIILQVFSFLKPALSKKEYRFAQVLIPLALVLFIVGFFYGVMIMRSVIGLLYTKSVELQIGNLLDITTLLSKILVTSSLMGVAFQFPVALILLMKFRILRHQDLVSHRMIFHMAAIIFAMLLPPTDLLSLVLLTLPLAFLFELTLLLSQFFIKNTFALVKGR